MQRTVSLVYYVGPAQTADESRYAACCVTVFLKNVCTQSFCMVMKYERARRWM